MPALAYIELTDKLRCQGSRSVYGVLDVPSLNSATDVRAIDDQESLTFSFSRFDETDTERDFAVLLRAGRIVTVVYDDDTFDEWRVGPVVRGRGQKGLITVTCVPLLLDLAERADSATGCGWVSEVSAGSRVFEYSLVERTAADILATYVIPNLPSWVTAGTVDPTFVIPVLDVSRMTPLALWNAVRDALRAVDIPCEVQLRRNGTTDYKLDLVTQIGASANVPVFHPANALLELTEKSDPTLQATRVLVKGGTNPNGDPGEWGLARWRGGAPSGNVIALTDRNGGASPIAFDNQFVGNSLLRVKTGRTFPITASSAALGTVTLSSVSTIAADEDFEFRRTEPLSNTRTTTTRYAVSAVPDGTHITCGASNPITANGQYTDWYARVWSLAVGGVVIATTRISTSVAATDVLTVASSAGVTTSHFVEFIQLDGAGEVFAFVDHPTDIQPDPTGYGLKVMEMSRIALGVTQLVPSAWMRNWASSGSPPDGWTSATVTQGISRNSAAAFTRYGGFSWKFTHVINVVDDATFITPPAYPDWDTGHAQISCRAWVYFTSYGSTAIDCRSALSVYALTASGGLGAQLAKVEIKPSASTATATVPSTDAWVELKIDGITLDGTTAPYGVVGVFRVREDLGVAANSSTITGYLDAIEMYPFGACPNDSFEFGDAPSLLQSGNNMLRDVSSPPLHYTMAVLDLERVFPSEFDRLALTLGGDVRAPDLEEGTDVTIRLLTLSRDLLDAKNTTLTLANRATRLTKLIADLRARTSRVVSVIQQTARTSAAVTSYVPLTTATTLPTNAEFSTAAAGAPTVTLGDDTAVTYQPADPTTAPTKTVTIGTPPSRLRALPLL